MKVVIVNLYVGARPAYFDLFLLSCARNPAVDFLFFVDFDAPAWTPPNVRFVHTSLDALRLRLQAHFDFPIALPSPYKLCDFRPAYGEVFADHFAGYDWWGHCDFDLLWGDLSPVLDVARADRHVKLFRRGHLTLYRNTARVNRIYRTATAALDHRRVFGSAHFHLFDETNGIDRVFEQQGLPVYRAELMADITPRSGRLRMTSQPNLPGQYFIWDNGRLCCRHAGWRVGAVPSEREFIYIHLQKRHLAAAYRPVHADEPRAITITPFGLHDQPASSSTRLPEQLSCLPNPGHWLRYYGPRVRRTLARRWATA